METITPALPDVFVINKDINTLNNIAEYITNSLAREYKNKIHFYWNPHALLRAVPENQKCLVITGRDCSSAFEGSKESPIVKGADLVNCILIKNKNLQFFLVSTMPTDDFFRENYCYAKKDADRGACVKKILKDYGFKFHPTYSFLKK